MTKFLSSVELDKVLMMLSTHEDPQTVLDSLDRGLYVDSVTNHFDWMTLGETFVQETDNFFEVDFLALRQQDYVVVTSDGCLFKIKIHFGTKYDMPNYDDFAVAITQYRKTHGKKPTIYGDLAKELKCKTYVKMVEPEEITKKNGYWLNKQKLREILKGAYNKGVISLDTLLDKMEMFD